MDIMELGAIGELVGGVAVVATLVYLAAQVRQNTRLATSTSQREVNNEFRKSLDGLSQYRELVVNGLLRFGDMSKEEQWLFSFRITPLFSTLDQAVEMHQQGLETEDKVAVYGDIVLCMLQEPGGSQWWKLVQPFYARTPGGRYLEDRLRRANDLPPLISTTVPWFAPDQAAARTGN